MENSAAFIPQNCREVLIEWLSGAHYTEIAQKRGVTKQRVEQIVARYVPEKTRHRMKSYPYYSALQVEIRKKFSSIYALSQAAGLSASTVVGAMCKGTSFRMDTAELIYKALDSVLPYSELFKKTEEEK